MRHFVVQLSMFRILIPSQAALPLGSIFGLLSGWFIGLVLLAIVVILVVVIRMRRAGPDGTSRGMKQFARMMRDESYASELVQELRDRSSLVNEISSGRATAFATDAEIATWVEMMLSGAEDDYPVFYGLRLRAVGPRAKPHLLRALDDPRCVPRGYTYEPSKAIRSAFQNVMSHLNDAPLPELVNRAKTWVKSSDPDVCEIGAQTLALSGADEAISVLQTILATPIPEPAGDLESLAFKRRDMLIKAKRAVYASVSKPVLAGVATRRFQTELATSLWKVVERSTQICESKALGPLLDLDSSAASRLSTAAFLRLDLPGLDDLIRCFAERNLGLPTDFLRLVIRTPEGGFGKGTFRLRCIQDACQILCLQLGPAAKEDLEFVLSDEQSDDLYLIKAGEGLLGIQGLPTFYKLLDLNQPGCPRPLEVLGFAWRLSMEYDNGGISQFFCNSSGETWQECVKALREMGCPVTANSVEQYAARLGLKPGGKSGRDTYAELSDERESELEAQARIFAGDERLVRRSTEYILAHADQIKSWINKQNVAT